MTTLVRLNNRLAPAYAGHSPNASMICSLDSSGRSPTVRAAGREPIRLDVSEDAKRLSRCRHIARCKEGGHPSVGGPERNHHQRGNQARSQRSMKAKKFCTQNAFTARPRAYLLSARKSTMHAVQAKYIDGVLNLVLPKKAPVSAKRVNDRIIRPRVRAETRASDMCGFQLPSKLALPPRFKNHHRD